MSELSCEGKSLARLQSKSLKAKFGATLLVLGLVTLASQLAVANPALRPIRSCRDLFVPHRTAFELVHDEVFPPEEVVVYDNDVSYVREIKRAEAAGLMDSYYDSKFQTRFYYAGTGRPHRDGRFPLVDPDAKAVYILFHGSGTMRSSGRNFNGLMNSLGQLGYSAIAVDMPFHKEGPMMEAFYDIDKFMPWVNSIVEHVRAQAPGKPIYLAGHSFGPDVIAEYLTRYPFSVKAAALMSPAGFDPVLMDWYKSHTSKMDFGGDVQINPAADAWAERMAKQFTWNKNGGRRDPTKVNPDLVVRVMLGDQEEYVPSPLDAKGRPSGKNTYDVEPALRSHLSRITFSLEEGVGHYLFNHYDAKGRNVVLRELLALDGVDSLQVTAIMMKRSQELDIRLAKADRLATAYGRDRIFRQWVQQAFTPRAFWNAVERMDEPMLLKIEAEYFQAAREREARLGARILAIADKDPQFYIRYKRVIDEMRAGRMKNQSSLYPALAEYFHVNGMQE